MRGAADSGAYTRCYARAHLRASPANRCGRRLGQDRACAAGGVELSCRGSGGARVDVKEGDQAQVGAVLISLETAGAEAVHAEAQAALARAEAHLAELKAGPRPEELAAAQAAVDAALAQVARLKEAARPEEVASAEAALAAARAEQARVRQGSDADEVAAAAADLANAEAAVRQAQAAYDQIKGNPDVGRYPQALQLEQATNALAAAQARYRQAAKAPSAADLARAQAGVDQAVAALAQVQAVSRPSTIAAAEAEVRRVQAQFDLLKAGARPETDRRGAGRCRPGGRRSPTR